VRAVASVSSIIVIGGIALSTVLRKFAPGANVITASEATVLFAFRISILRVIIGVIGLVSSFAFVSSILTMAGGAVAVATMRSLKFAIEVVGGRIVACSQPMHGANLASKEVQESGKMLPNSL